MYIKYWIKQVYQSVPSVCTRVVTLAECSSQLTGLENLWLRIQQIGVTEMIIFGGSENIWIQIFGGSENIWIQNIWGVRKSKFKKSIQADTTDRSNRDDYIWGVRISNMITQIFNIIIFGGSENLNLRNWFRRIRQIEVTEMMACLLYYLIWGVRKSKFKKYIESVNQSINQRMDHVDCGHNRDDGQTKAFPKINFWF